MESYNSDGIQYGNRKESPKDGACRPYSISFEQLELDRVYDVGELGTQCGTVIFYVDTDDITPQHAARLMLEIRRLMDQGKAAEINIANKSAANRAVQPVPIFRTVVKWFNLYMPKIKFIRLIL